jgi:hypothetical protein
MIDGTAGECGCLERDCSNHLFQACKSQTTCYPFMVPDSAGWNKLVWLCPRCYENVWKMYAPLTQQTR